jgi:prepilin-type N-terminal cleavage/methylation domain-containing protein
MKIVRTLNLFKKNNPQKVNVTHSSIPQVSQQMSRGFTMIEMLITLGIFSVLTAVVVFQYGQFNSQTIMTNMAYEVALATRQAQVYALGVRADTGTGIPAVDTFENRYGMYFNVNSEDEKTFIFFIDRGENGDVTAADGICNDGSGGAPNCFSCASDSECLEKYSVMRDIYLDKICTSTNGNLIDDDGNCLQSDITELTVTFQRPNPDAIIAKPSPYKKYVDAAIVLGNNFGDQRAVIIKETGNISVKKLNNTND